MRNCLFISVFFFLFSTVKGQDPHFSQYTSTLVYNNPAYTGAFSGNYRLGVHVRDQWFNNIVPYKSAMATLDMPLFSFSSFGDNRNSQIAAGLMVLSQKAGDGNFGSSEVQLTANYIKAFSRFRSNIIAIAFRGGIVNKSFDPSAFYFDNQYNQAENFFSGDAAPGEVLLNTSIAYSDISAGAMWHYSTAGDRMDVSGGISVFHINRPDQSFDNAPSPLFRKYNFLFKMRGYINEQIELLPSALVSLQGPHREAVFGNDVRFKLDRDLHSGYRAFYAGLHYRYKDALIINTKYELYKFILGFSYDLNFSGFTKATNAIGGGPEFSLQYIAPKPRSIIRRNSLYCPRFL